MQAPPTRFLERQDGRLDSGSDLAHWLAERAREPENRGALDHWEIIPARPARFGELSLPLPEPLEEALGHQGISRLYTHQVQAIEALRAGLDTVVVTGTASGKSLCYHLPVMERLLSEPGATALYLFPTKALAQDQLKGLTRLATGHPRSLEAADRAGVYDGDTQPATRRKLRDSANLILSNPDMLHQGILPVPSQVGAVPPSLRYVVVDEMHAYRGIFGSHVANVFRRLERVVRQSGATATCSRAPRSAIPASSRTAMIGRPVRVVDDDGSPRGERHFVFWNPPYLDGSRVERRSSNGEGCSLFTGLVARGAQALGVHQVARGGGAGLPLRA